jgi:hypothetical protein
MATEKQILANRRNAQKSTGPKTAAGRLKSSRNAFRHGLSLPLRLDTATSAKIDAIAQVVTRDQADEEQLSAAPEFAEAQLQLLRIRGVRAELMATFDITCGDYHKLQQLAALTTTSASPSPSERRASGKL